jgi:hypothetical protein
MMLGITEVFSERFLMISPRAKAWHGTKKVSSESGASPNVFILYWKWKVQRLYLALTAVVG